MYGLIFPEIFVIIVQKEQKLNFLKKKFQLICFVISVSIKGFIEKVWWIQIKWPFINVWCFDSYYCVSYNIYTEGTYGFHLYGSTDSLSTFKLHLRLLVPSVHILN